MKQSSWIGIIIHIFQIKKLRLTGFSGFKITRAVSDSQNFNPGVSDSEGYALFPHYNILNVALLFKNNLGLQIPIIPNELERLVFLE